MPERVPVALGCAVNVRFADGSVKKEPTAHTGHRKDPREPVVVLARSGVEPLVTESACPDPRGRRRAGRQKVHETGRHARPAGRK